MGEYHDWAHVCRDDPETGRLWRKLTEAERMKVWPILKAFFKAVTV